MDNGQLNYFYTYELHLVLKRDNKIYTNKLFFKNESQIKSSCYLVKK
jgi:hypothetical protein